MSTTYRECPACGKRALSVATRCPQCGLEFPAGPLVRPGTGPGLRRGPGLVPVTVGLVAAAVLVSPLRGHRGATAGAGRAGLSDRVTRTAAAVDSGSAAQTATDPVGRGTPRVVINWANLRRDRARTSPVVGRLEPGDSVLVDSLSRGWYRVLMDGRPVGYVHRSSVGSVLPPGTP